jgi:hypothetical protein
MLPMVEVHPRLRSLDAISRLPSGTVWEGYAGYDSEGNADSDEGCRVLALGNSLLQFSRVTRALPKRRQ